MENVPLVVLAVVGVFAITGLVLEFTAAATAKAAYEVPYEQYQSTSQKCLIACDERFVPRSEAYQYCVQDCLPPMKPAW